MERRGSDGLIARLDRFYIISSAGIACGFTVFMTPFLLFVQFFLAPEAVRAQPLWTQVLNVTGVILYLPVFVFLALMSYRSFLSFLRPTAWYTRFPILAALVALWTYFGPAIQKAFWAPIYSYYNITVPPADAERYRAAPAPAARRRQARPSKPAAPAPAAAPTDGVAGEGPPEPSDDTPVADSDPPPIEEPAVPSAPEPASTLDPSQ